MYWRLKSIPELRDLPPSQRRQLWRRALRDPFRSADVLRLVVILATIVALVLLQERAEEFIRTRWVRLIVFLAVVILAQWVVFAIMAQRLRPMLRAMRESDD